MKIIERTTDDQLKTGAVQYRMAPVTSVRAAPDGETAWDHEFYASTNQIDRYDEIISPRAFEATLPKYLGLNPVILFAHNHRELPVGKSVTGSIDDNGLVVRIKWAPTDLGNQIKMLYDKGFMHALSVGFIPLEWTTHSESEIRAGMPYRTHTKVDLLEISAVPVPANPGAVIQNDISDLQVRLSEAEKKDITVEAVRGALGAILTDELAEKTFPHHTSDRVNHKALAHGIGLLNGHMKNEIAPETRTALYEHMVQHLVNDFGVDRTHIAALMVLDNDGADMKTEPKVAIEVTLSDELKAAFGEIKSLVSDISTRMTALEQKPAPVALGAPMEEPASAAAASLDPTPPADEDEDMVVLDFDLNDVNTAELVNAISRRIFGTP